MDTKTCSMCGKEKPTAEFYKQAGRVGGVQTKCKLCFHIKVKKSNLKKCFFCKETKNRDAFRDGSSLCKKCEPKYMASRYHNKKAYYVIKTYKGVSYTVVRTDKHVSGSQMRSLSVIPVIYEDENADVKFKSLIFNKSGTNHPRSLRPKEVNIIETNKEDVNALMDRYHYIGKCNGTYYIGIYYKSKIIGGMIMRRPVRQNSGDWEIARMIMHSDYRVHGVWSYIMAKVLPTLISGKVVTFSDNRIMSGKVYEHMGMSKVCAIPSDYYWCKDGKRHHKSALRKKTGEIGTEYELREAQGYVRVYDCGKTKWEVTL